MGFKMTNEETDNVVIKISVNKDVASDLSNIASQRGTNVETFIYDTLFRELYFDESEESTRKSQAQPSTLQQTYFAEPLEDNKFIIRTKVTHQAENKDCVDKVNWDDLRRNISRTQKD